MFDSTKVRRWRLRVRFALIQERGGKCERCGWSGHTACYDWHHTDPSTKTATVAALIGSGCGIDRIKEEVAKCELLCAMCHRLEHSGPEYDPAVDGLLRFDREPDVKCSSADCQRMVRPDTKTGLCGSCARKSAQAGWDDVPDLVKAVIQYGMVKTAARFGRSDNALRHHLRRNGVPDRTKRGLKEYLVQHNIPV